VTDARVLEAELSKLRMPFAPEAINKLPKGIDSSKPKASCKECGGYHSPAKVHLDYVGHAEVTDRLLEVDPLWNWEPLAYDDQGLPRLVYDPQGHPIGLWIKLTICGVTRLGYGSCEPGKFDAIKELIGDALRNSGQRFGVALDLWKKDRGHDEPRKKADKADSGKVAAPEPQAGDGSTAPVPAPSAVSLEELKALMESYGVQTKKFAGYIKRNFAKESTDDLTPEERIHVAQVIQKFIKPKAAS
jgi:hypothetical protein